MKSKSQASVLLRLACAALVFASPAWCTGETRLVQSIPKETALAHPDLAFAKDVWVEMIRSARSELDFAEFYIAQEPGGALGPVLDELEKAGQRGVRIRFVLSPRMLDQDVKAYARLRAVKGIELRLFDLKGVSSGILHAKYFLVDGAQAFIGSQNFDWRALEHIHELGVRSTDPAIVKPLKAVFEADWRFSLDKGLPTPTAPPVAASVAVETELVASPPFLLPAGIRPSGPALVELIGEARKHIQVQLLTYSPVSGKAHYWPAIDSALRAAAVRGVQVELMISDWVLKSRGLAHLKALSLIPNITVKIVSIPEASTGHIPFSRTIHSKYMVVDDSVLWLGTSNWEEDYFAASRNVEVILRQLPLATQAGQIYGRLWTSEYAKAIEPMKLYTPRKVD
jgi:phosphatidylserine/phosphatidylglycerophosphate/cardiolipin synthase-like enzyme